jgi:hypothetical protein
MLVVHVWMREELEGANEMMIEMRQLRDMKFRREKVK